MKKWMKQYGIHIVICAVVLIGAFSFNNKINTERAHVYSITENAYSILKDINVVQEKNGRLKFQGWAFDTGMYNETSTCELILQDTETGEALWPKMEKNPEVVEIAERYTDGEDYSGASFAGNIKTSQLNEDSVYEILIRYTTDYVDENGNESQHIRTVTTDEFIYQGQMTEYNPKTFVSPAIAGTELEKELEGARLFHWFEEGMWVYYTEEKVFYIVQNKTLEVERNPKCPIHWFVQNEENLPEVRRQHGYGNEDFCFNEEGMQNLETAEYKVVIIDVPSNNITYYKTGLYYDESGWSYCVRKQWK